MRVLVGCEFSGTTRDAFIAAGHDAVSCDLLPSESPGPHIQGDVRGVLDQGWDMMVAFPPCQYLTLANSARWYETGSQRARALELVSDLLHAPIARIAVENPPGAIGTHIRKATQYAKPWWFGDPFHKLVGLWLSGLEPLRPETWVRPPGLPPWTRVHRDPRQRSRSFPGIARAMAEQWGTLTP